MPETYSQDDVQEILYLAIARQSEAGELTRVQLFEIAEDLGLSAHDVQLAEQEWRSRQDENKEQQAFLHYRRLRFRQHAIKYLIVNGFLILFDLVTFGDGDLTLTWSLYIALFWGMFLTLDGWSAMQTQGDAFERGYRRWKRKRWFHRSIGRWVNQWLRAL